jgi:hypothetical protein
VRGRTCGRSFLRRRWIIGLRCRRGVKYYHHHMAREGFYTAWKGARKTPTRGRDEGRGKCPHWIAGLSVGLPMASRARQTGDAYSDGLS